MGSKMERLVNTEGGTLDMVGGLYLLTVEGNREQLGMRHAELVKHISGDITARYYGTLLNNVIRHSFNGPTSGIRAAISAMLFRKIFSLFNKAKTKGGLLTELESLLAGLRLPARYARRLVQFPDILHYLAGKFAAHAPGCSALFLQKNKSKTGGAMLARNFDFFGAGVWDEFQAVKRYFPDDAQAYLWVGPLGIPVGGFGLNASGISIMPFTLFSRDCGMKGTPMFVVMDRILREAENLEQAMTILEEEKLSGSYSLMITDMNTGEAQTIGAGKKYREILSPEKSVLCRTNHQQTPEGRKSELLPFQWKRHSESRLFRLEEFLKKTRGKIGMEQLCTLLGDSRDAGEDRNALVGGILPAVNNALSVVLDWKGGRFAVGCGSFPVARRGHFEEFSISSFFKKKLKYLGAINVKTGLTEEEMEAVNLYEAAWHAWFDRTDGARALRLLRDGGAMAPEEPAFPRMSGLLHLKFGDWDWAVRDLKRAFELEPEGGQRRAETGLWLGRALESAGYREEALEIYDRVMALDKNGRFGNAAYAAGKKPWSRSKSHRIIIDLVTATAE